VCPASAPLASSVRQPRSPSSRMRYYIINSPAPARALPRSRVSPGQRLRPARPRGPGHRPGLGPGCRPRGRRSCPPLATRSTFFDCHLLVKTQLVLNSPGTGQRPEPRRQHRPRELRLPSGAWPSGGAGYHGNGGARRAPPRSAHRGQWRRWAVSRGAEGAAVRDRRERGRSERRGAAAMFGGLGRCFEEDPFFR